MTVDLTTNYLGLQLATPLVAAACPVTASITNLLALEEAGAGAVVLPSLFEEQLTRDGLQTLTSEVSKTRGSRVRSDPEADVGDLTQYNAGPWGYVDLLKQAKARLGIPVIASINASGGGRWLQHARFLQESGADALELNVYLSITTPEVTGQAVERHLVALVKEVRAAVELPLAVKLCAAYSSVPYLAKRLADAGANGLVLFNRSLEPDVDLEARRVIPSLRLSSPREVSLPLRWIGVLRGAVDVHLAAVSGVYSGDDAAKYLLVGADVVMTASALLERGVEHLATIKAGLERRLVSYGCSSVDDVRGSLSYRRCADSSAYERTNYIDTVTSWGGPDAEQADPS